MDLIVRVAALPRPGETVAGDDLLRAPGGKGGNQAVAAVRLGAAVAMIGHVGHDAFGRELKRSLRNEGVSTRWVLGSDRPTGAALIFVDARGENVIAVSPGANQDPLPGDGALLRRAIGGAEVLVAALEVPLPSIEEAFLRARALGRRTVLNAAPAAAVPASLLRLCDVVICNEVELATLLGDEVSDSAAGARALRAFHDQVVVVTLGRRGAIAVSSDGEVRQAAFEVSTVDSVGAGDAFVAGFVTARWWSAGLSAALRWGCAAGALATTKVGAQPSMPLLADVDALLSRR